jgi:hypothetical protein
MQPDILDMLKKDNAKAGVEREKNRARMAEHMPDCLRLIDELKAAGMFGKVVSFELRGVRV